MGYTHYWYRKESLDEKQFEDMVSDFQKIQEHLDVDIAGPMGNNHPIMLPGEIHFNGREDDSHETFSIERVFPKRSYSIERDGKQFAFCKTAYKPYDIAVVCILIIAKHMFDKDIKVSSDGNDMDWREGKELCQQVLGYGQEYFLYDEIGLSKGGEFNDGENENE